MHMSACVRFPIAHAHLPAQLQRTRALITLSCTHGFLVHQGTFNNLHNFGLAIEREFGERGQQRRRRLQRRLVFVAEASAAADLEEA